MARRTILLATGVLVAIFVSISLIALALQADPPVVQEPNWDSAQTRALARRACFDCHSNETRWPWFARIPPGSWLATLDMVRGRRHVNFSEWNPGRGGRAARESAQLIREGEMPPALYLMLHPEARLTDTEKQQLIQGLQTSLQ